MTNKLCTDCKHFVLNPDWSSTDYKIQHAICGRTSTVVRHTGERCDTERSAPFFYTSRCGKQARYFEAKETP